MLLLPLPHGEGRARQWLRRLAAAVLAVLPAALWTAAATATVATPRVPRFTYEAGPLWTGPPAGDLHRDGPGAQAKILMEKPALLATLCRAISSAASST